MAEWEWMPDCIGVLGWIFGHSFETHYYPRCKVCRRCGFTIDLEQYRR